MSENWRVKRSDGNIYGPVDTETIKEWLQEERISPEDYIAPEDIEDWQPVQSIEQFADLFRVETPPAGRKCPGCGNVYPDSAMICTKCGINLTTGERLVTKSTSRKTSAGKPIVIVVLILAILGGGGYLLLKSGILGSIDISKLSLGKLGEDSRRVSRSISMKENPCEGMNSNELMEALKDDDAKVRLGAVRMFKDIAKGKQIEVGKSTVPQAESEDAPASATVSGKYSRLLKKLHIPEDKGQYGDFKDWGHYTGTSYKGHQNLPAGYWVYVCPHWYIWGDCKGVAKPSSATAAATAQKTESRPAPESDAVPELSEIKGIENYKMCHLPAVTDRVLYTASMDGNFYAVDLKTGKSKWRYESGQGLGSFAAPIADGLIFILSGEHLYALNQETGKEKWKFNAGYPERAPAVAEGTLYFGKDDKTLYALDIKTGKEKWKFEAEGDQRISSPVVVEGMVYFGAGMADLAAVDAQTGVLKWKSKLSGGGFLSGAARPAVYEGLVYFPAMHLYAFDCQTGEEKWKVDSAGQMDQAPPVVDGVVFGTDAQYVKALDCKTGKELWNIKRGGDTTDNLVAEDGVLYFMGSSHIYAYDLETKGEKWKISARYDNWSRFIFTDGTIYFNKNPVLYELGAGGGILAQERIEERKQVLEKALPTLMQVYKKDKNSQVRAEALGAIAAIQGEEAVSLLSKALDDSDELVVNAAVSELQAMGPAVRKSIPGLSQKLTKKVEAKMAKRKFDPAQTANLFAAMGAEDPEAMKKALAQGADPNAEHRGCRAVWRAAQSHSWGKGDGSIEKAREMVKVLAENGGDVCRKYWGDNTVLHWAAQYGFMDIAEIALEKGADVNAIEDMGSTPLHNAVWGDRTEMSKFLIDAGANINIKNQQDKTPLERAEEMIKAYSVPKEKKKWQDLARYMKEKGTKGPAIQVDKTKYDSLQDAVRAKRMDAIKYLLKKGADVSGKGAYNTPLYVAILEKSPDIAKFLIEKGADVNVQNRGDGSTALMIASRLKATDLVKLLLEKGANVNVKNKKGETALALAAYSYATDIMRILIEKGAEVNVKDYRGYTPLHSAVGRKDQELVQLILAKGADIQAKTKNGETPFDLALTAYDKSVLKLLIYSGADVNTVPKRGKPALLAALDRDDQETAKLLVSKGANVNVKDGSSGITALHRAVMGGHKDLVKLLLEKGADVNAKDSAGRTAMGYARYANAKVRNEITALLRKHGAK